MTKHVSDAEFFHACAMRQLRKEHPHSPLAALERLAVPLAAKLRAEATGDDPQAIKSVMDYGRVGMGWAN